MAKEKGERTVSEETREFARFAEDLAAETDRAAVILGAAKLDIQLYQLLHRYLLPDSGTADELLEGDAPLASFSARIKIAYRLGLIDREFARALHLVRKIRNSFAHELSDVALTSGSHRDRVRELVAPFKKMGDWSKLALQAHFKKHAGSRGEFRAVVAILILRLRGAFERVAPISDDKAQQMLPKVWFTPGSLVKGRASGDAGTTHSPGAGDEPQPK